MIPSQQTDWRLLYRAFGARPVWEGGVLRWIEITYRPLNWSARLLAYFGIYRGPQ